MNITLIGPSGAGKGTQAEKVSSQFGLQHVATGDLFRENLQQQSALGLLARNYMNQGELVPDEVVAAMIEECLRKSDSNKGFLFDGFPQTKFQAKSLDEMLNGQSSVDAAIYLNVSEEEIANNRIPGRLTCSDCQRPYHESYNPPEKPFVCDNCGGDLYRRNDDTPLLARNRLKTFHRQIVPIINYYQEAKKLIIIDGEGSIEEVTQKVIEAIEALTRGEAEMATGEEVNQIYSLTRVPRALTKKEVTSESIDVVLLGAPGSGKGTQADNLSQEFGLKHVATGDLFRENLKKQTDLGKLAKSFMDRGELVPDDVTQGMVRERLSRPDTQQGVLLDGFPRTLPQAEALTEIMSELGRRVDGVLYIKVSDEEIVKRLSGRWICRECQTPFHTIFKPPKEQGVCDNCGGKLYQRDDDKPKTIRNRLKTFHGQTAPLVDYYIKAGLLVEIDGEGKVEEVTERTSSAIQDLMEEA